MVEKGYYSEKDAAEAVKEILEAVKVSRERLKHYAPSSGGPKGWRKRATLII